jgi:hypothetical protein
VAQQCDKLDKEFMFSAVSRIEHKELPPLDALNKHLYLDGSSPSGLRWLKPTSNRMKVNDIFGTKTGKYWKGALSVDGKRNVYMAHRLIFYMKTGIDPKELLIDHVKTVEDNNNIRLATPYQNVCNSVKQSTYKGNSVTSEYKGVSWSKHSKCWEAAINANGKSIKLGHFDLEHEAAHAYNIAALKFHEGYAKLNELSQYQEMVNDENYTYRSKRTTTSKYYGVSLVKKNGKWRARIVIKGKLIHLGYFDCELDAARSYNVAAIRKLGVKAKLNQIE